MQFFFCFFSVLSLPAMLHHLILLFVFFFTLACVYMRFFPTVIIIIYAELNKTGFVGIFFVYKKVNTESTHKYSELYILFKTNMLYR